MDGSREAGRPGWNPDVTQDTCSRGGASAALTSSLCFWLPQENYYRPPGQDACLPCDCFPHGSHSRVCDMDTGQCSCKPGVIGRQCNRCDNPFAEVTVLGCEGLHHPRPARAVWQGRALWVCLWGGCCVCARVRCALLRRWGVCVCTRALCSPGAWGAVCVHACTALSCGVGGA